MENDSILLKVIGCAFIITIGVAATVVSSWFTKDFKQQDKQVLQNKNDDIRDLRLQLSKNSQTLTTNQIEIESLKEERDSFKDLVTDSTNRFEDLDFRFEQLEARFQAALKYIESLEQRNRVLRDSIMLKTSAYLRTLDSLRTVNQQNHHAKCQSQRDLENSINELIFHEMKQGQELLKLHKMEIETSAAQKRDFMPSTFESMNLNILDIIDQFGIEFYYSSIVFIKVVIAYYPFRHLILYNWIEKMRKTNGGINVKDKSF